MKGQGMKLSVRAATMVVVGILMMAMVAPSATAVAPGRSALKVRCDDRVERVGHGWGRHWEARLILENNRNQRTTVYGSWFVDGPHGNDTFRHHAELAAGERKVFRHGISRGREGPTVDLLRCVESS